MFVPESFDHPARAQLFMVEELVKYLSEPGDMIVDPFGGSGTLLAGMTMGRGVGLIELSPDYFDLCVRNAEFMMEKLGYYTETPQQFIKPSINEGPNQDLIPNFQDIQAFIFSPPYAGALASAGGKLADYKEWERILGSHAIESTTLVQPEDPDSGWWKTLYLKVGKTEYRISGPLMRSREG